MLWIEEYEERRGGKASLQVEIGPKKDDWPCWSSSLLGAASYFGDDCLDTGRSAHAHGRPRRNLTVRYSRSENEIDRKLFR
jgi:hypothetical protein